MSKHRRNSGRPGQEDRLRKQIETLKRRLTQTEEETERRQIAREIDRLKAELEDLEDDYS
jgi:hypothetical protein